MPSSVEALYEKLFKTFDPVMLPFIQDSLSLTLRYMNHYVKPALGENEPTPPLNPNGLVNPNGYVNLNLAESHVVVRSAYLPHMPLRSPTSLVEDLRAHDIEPDASSLDMLRAVQSLLTAPLQLRTSDGHLYSLQVDLAGQVIWAQEGLARQRIDLPPDARGHLASQFHERFDHLFGPDAQVLQGETRLGDIHALLTPLRDSLLIRTWDSRTFSIQLAPSPLLFGDLELEADLPVFPVRDKNRGAVDLSRNSAGEFNGHIDYGEKTIPSMSKSLGHLIRVDGEPLGSLYPPPISAADALRQLRQLSEQPNLALARREQLRTLIGQAERLERTQRAIWDLALALDDADPAQAAAALGRCEDCFQQYHRNYLTLKDSILLDTRSDASARAHPWPINSLPRQEIYARARQSPNGEAALFDWSRQYAECSLSTQFRPFIQNPLYLLYAAFSELREIGYKSPTGNWMARLLDTAIAYERSVDALPELMRIPFQPGRYDLSDRLFDHMQLRANLLAKIEEGLDALHDAGQTVGSQPLPVASASARRMLKLYSLNISHSSPAAEFFYLRQFEQSFQTLPGLETYVQSLQACKSQAQDLFAALFPSGSAGSLAKTLRLKTDTALEESVQELERISPLLASTVRSFRQIQRNQVWYKENMSTPFSWEQVASGMNVMRELITQLKERVGPSKLDSDGLVLLRQLLYPHTDVDASEVLAHGVVYDSPNKIDLRGPLSDSMLGSVFSPRVAKALAAWRDAVGRTDLTLSDAYFELLADTYASTRALFGEGVSDALFHPRDGRHQSMNKSLGDESSNPKKNGKHFYDKARWTQAFTPLRGTDSDYTQVLIQSEFARSFSIHGPSSIQHPASSVQITRLKPHVSAHGPRPGTSDLNDLVGLPADSQNYAAWMRYARDFTLFANEVIRCSQSSFFNEYRLIDLVNNHYTFSRGSKVVLQSCDPTHAAIQLFPDVFQGYSFLPTDQLSGVRRCTTEAEHYLLVDKKVEIDCVLKSGPVDRQMRWLAMQLGPIIGAMAHQEVERLQAQAQSSSLSRECAPAGPDKLEVLRQSRKKAVSGASASDPNPQPRKTCASPHKH